MYYLQSRYYNPEWGRFINADSIVGETGDLLSHNMFAYCKNNCVNLQDQDGDIPTILIGACIGVGTQLLADRISGTHSTAGTYASAAFVGALSGGTGGFAIFSRIVGGAIVKQAVDNKSKGSKWNWGDFIADSAVNIGGEVLGGVSGKIISKYKNKKNYSQTAYTLKKKGITSKAKIQKKLVSSTRNRICLGKMQNWTVSLGYTIISSK